MPLPRSPSCAAARGLVLAALALAPGCGRRDDPAPARPPPAARPAVYDTAGKPLVALGARGPRPHLLIVVLEQLRGDRCGDVVAGAAAASMPNLERLAEAGDAFLHAVTPCPEASAALASLLTGLSPARHRAGLEDPLARVDERLATLGEILTAAGGYAARAFVADERLARSVTLWQGFELHPERVGLQEAPEAIAAWIASQPDGRPTCAVLVADECAWPYGEANHAPRRVAPGAHLRPLKPWQLAEEMLLDRFAFPYRVEHRPDARREALRYLFEGWGHAPRPELAERLRQAYDAGVAWADGLLGALLERLGRDALVVVTSTGGTAFGEHGLLGPGRDLHDEQVRVPLVFGGGTFLTGEGGWAKTASLVDVLPTLLDVLELPALPDLTGVSLRRVLLGEVARGPVVSQEQELPVSTGVPGAKATLVAVRSQRWKYVVRFDVRAGTVVERAYDLDADPGERRDLATDGVAGGVPFDDAFCEAVERVRDGLWGGVRAMNALVTEPYGQGERVLTDRPPPCGAR